MGSSRLGTKVLVAIALAVCACGDPPAPSPPSPTPDGGSTSPTPTAIPTPTASAPESVVWLAGCGSGPICSCRPNGNYCDEGVLARSDDLGRSWTTTFFDHGLGSVAFADRRRGFAVGFPSAILYTEDAGDSWLDGSDRAEMPPFANGLAGLTAVRFLDSDRGVILGRGVTDIGDSLWLGFATEGFVLRTEDGGRSWFPAEIASEIPLARHGGVEGGSFTSVCFTPDGIGLVAGNPPLVSHDFGRTWTNIEQRLIPNGSGPRWESAHEAPQGAACQPNGLWLASPSRVFGSKDGGDTWTILSEPSSGGIFAQVSFRDLQTGWLTEGGVLRTEDGGVTWTEVDNGIIPRIGSAATVFLSETDLLSTSFTAVSVSNDGGATWNVFNVPTPGKIFGLVDVAVVD